MHGIKVTLLDEWECERARRIKRNQGNRNEISLEKESHLKVFIKVTKYLIDLNYSSDYG